MALLLFPQCLGQPVHSSRVFQVRTHLLPSSTLESRARESESETQRKYETTTTTTHCIPEPAPISRHLQQLVCPNSIVISVSLEQHLLAAGAKEKLFGCPANNSFRRTARQFFEVANFGTVPPSSDAIPRQRRATPRRRGESRRARERSKWHRLGS